MNPPEQLPLFSRECCGSPPHGFEPKKKTSKKLRSRSPKCCENSLNFRKKPYNQRCSGSL